MSSKTAPHSEAPKYYSIKPGGDNLPHTLKVAVNHLKNINRIKNEVYIVGDHIHEAFTNMKYISLSGDYIGLAIHENYHGYSPEHLTQDLSFVVQHEIGHLNVHPTQAGGWLEEIKAMPVEGSKKGYWSNVLSDITVNYNIANGTQLQLSGKPKEEAVKIMNHAVWSAYAGGFRSCMGSPITALNGQTLHRRLVEAGQLVNNLANGGVFTNPAPGKSIYCFRCYTRLGKMDWAWPRTTTVLFNCLCSISSNARRHRHRPRIRIKHDFAALSRQLETS